VIALRAHAEVLRELVVAIVRAALRARVRVRLLIGRRLREIAMLDRNVDALGHVASLDVQAEGGGEPRHRFEILVAAYEPAEASPQHRVSLSRRA
jgi:hypothetical protein